MKRLEVEKLFLIGDFYFFIDFNKRSYCKLILFKKYFEDMTKKSSLASVSFDCKHLTYFSFNKLLIPLGDKSYKDCIPILLSPLLSKYINELPSCVNNSSQTDLLTSDSIE
jgi:hypothetical protein